MKRGGMITIPKPVRDEMGLIEGDILRITVEKTGMVLNPPIKLKGIFKNEESLDLRDP